MGVDVSPSAVAQARDRGAPVIRRSVFEDLPGNGRWGTVLLMDGNVGIGGNPVALLRRVRDLIRRSGRVLAEVAPPGIPARRLRVRLEGASFSSDPFPWAEVGADGVAAVARAAGFFVRDVWSEGFRWFAQLQADAIS